MVQPQGQLGAEPKRGHKTDLLINCSGHKKDLHHGAEPAYHPLVRQIVPCRLTKMRTSSEALPQTLTRHVSLTAIPKLNMVSPVHYRIGPPPTRTDKDDRGCYGEGGHCRARQGQHAAVWQAVLIGRRGRVRRRRRRQSDHVRAYAASACCIKNASAQGVQTCIIFCSSATRRLSAMRQWPCGELGSLIARSRLH